MAKERVYLTDVGPRDGLQNQSKLLTVRERVLLISALIDAGVKQIEAGAFVSPKAVPAMADTDQVLAAVPRKPDTRLQVLVPNLKGYQLAQQAGADQVLFVVCATETMNQKNVRLSIENSVQQLAEILAQAKADQVDVLTCIAVAWHCPFEGLTPVSSVQRLQHQLLDIGANQLVLADTIGAANPASVKQLLAALHGQGQNTPLACHFHDTRAMGMANVAAALDSGIRHFDSSIGGLGGCPFAPGATGNVATEDLVMMLEQMGLDTGIDAERLFMAGHLAGTLTAQATGGRAHKWRQLQLAAGKSIS